MNVSSRTPPFLLRNFPKSILAAARDFKTPPAIVTASFRFHKTYLRQLIASLQLASITLLGTGPPSKGQGGHRSGQRAGVALQTRADIGQPGPEAIRARQLRTERRVRLRLQRAAKRRRPEAAEGDPTPHPGSRGKER